MNIIYLLIKNFSKQGGTELICYNLYKYLKEQNYTVHVICAINRTDETENVIETRYLHVGRAIKTYTFVKRAQRILSHIPHPALTISFGTVPNCDIFFTGGIHKNFLHKSIFGYAGLNKTKKSVSRAINPINWYLPLLDNKIYASQDTKCFVAVSNLAAKELKKSYNIPDHKIKIIPNGVDKKRFSITNRTELRKTTRKKFGLHPGQKAIGFCGTNFELKGLRFIIHALANLPSEYVLLIAGNRNPKKFLHLAQKLGLSNRVKFLGFITNIEYFFAALDVYCHPSAYETFGCVVAESISMGVPAVTSDHVGASMVIEQGKNGLVLSFKDIEKNLPEAIKKTTKLSIDQLDVSKIPSQEISFKEILNTITSFSYD